MIEISNFKSLVTTGSNGETREELAFMPLSVGDTLKLTTIEEREVNGNKFAALLTDDEQMLSANAILRKGNGINFGTTNLADAAQKVYDAVNSAGGFTLTIAKVYRSESATGNKRNNYRFNPVTL